MNEPRGEAAIVPEGMLPPDVSGQWEPRVGPETIGLLTRKATFSPEERERLRSEAVGVLAQCLSPQSADAARRTGLVYGRVQSGKTLSFTAVVALAHDNEIPLVVILTGTKRNLTNQAQGRLRKDLDLDRPGVFRVWKPHSTVQGPALENPVRLAEEIAKGLSKWRDPSVDGASRPTVLLTAMKEDDHIAILTAALKTVAASGLLVGRSALLIDDECDQASLNLGAKQGKQSAIYRSIKSLRDVLPRHTYLGYTATPNATLLIEISDELSPDFARVLTAGSSYVSGADLFYEESPYVWAITDDSPEESLEPPSSLHKAMRLFFLAAAAGEFPEYALDNCSMMVHPSERVAQHERFRGMVEAYRDRVLEALSDASRSDHNSIVSAFSVCYDDISRTAKLPPFPQLLARLPIVVKDCTIRVLNAQNLNDEIPWNTNYAWILIGGALLDRGLSVEQLVGTYMSRGLGQGNADTLWQRARFLGYRESIKPMVRIGLVPDALQAFDECSQSEEFLRKQLIDFIATGRPFKQWRRALLLSRRLKPTRTQVLRATPDRYAFGENWWGQNRPHLTTTTAAADNRVAIDRLYADVGRFESSPDGRHLVGSVLLPTLLEDLLAPYVIQGERESRHVYLLTVLLAYLLDQSVTLASERADVYQMTMGQIRERSLNRGDVNIFDGRSGAYLGDEHIVDRDHFVVQVSRLDVYDITTETARDEHRERKLLAENVPALGIWVPKRIWQQLVTV